MLKSSLKKYFKTAKIYSVAPFPVKLLHNLAGTPEDKLERVDFFVPCFSSVFLRGLNLTIQKPF